MRKCEGAKNSENLHKQRFHMGKHQISYDSGVGTAVVVGRQMSEKMRRSEKFGKSTQTAFSHEETSDFLRSTLHGVGTAVVVGRKMSEKMQGSEKFKKYQFVDCAVILDKPIVMVGK